MALVLSPFLVDVTAFLLEFFLRSVPRSFTFCYRKDSLLPPGVAVTPPHPAGVARGRAPGLFLSDGAASQGTLKQLGVCLIFSLHYDFLF